MKIGMGRCRPRTKYQEHAYANVRACRQRVDLFERHGCEHRSVRVRRSLIAWLRLTQTAGSESHEMTNTQSKKLRKKELQEERCYPRPMPANSISGLNLLEEAIFLSLASYELLRTPRKLVK